MVTTIQINEDVKEKLDKLKAHHRETYNELISRLTDSNGLEIIKKIMNDALDKHDKAKIAYLGGGKFLLSVKMNDFKEAEIKLKEVLEFLENTSKEQKCEFSFKRDDSKKLKE